MAEPTERDWIVEGAPVYVARVSDVSRGIIERLTKTQVILQSGNRYNRSTLRQVGGDAWTSGRLLPPTDEWARGKERDQRLVNAAYVLEEAARELRRKPGGEALEKVEAALAKWRELFG